MSDVIPALSSNKRQFRSTRSRYKPPCVLVRSGITMHADRGVMPRLDLQHSKGAQRRRRLKRGVARWNLDRQLCAEPTRRVATVTLTVRSDEPEAAIGRVYRFLARVRRQWLGTRYFCWLELQRRGAVHYHLVWLNPPSLGRVDLIAWVQRAWGSDRTQVRFKDVRDGLQSELDYVMGYAKKMGRKSYQQRYDEVPRELRTFMSQRLEIPPKELDGHMSRDEYLYVPEATYRGERVPEHLEVVGHVDHVVPPGGRCSALDKRRLRSLPAARAPGRSGSAEGTDKACARRPIKNGNA